MPKRLPLQVFVVPVNETGDAFYLFNSKEEITHFLADNSDAKRLFETEYGIYTLSGIKRWRKRSVYEEEDV